MANDIEPPTSENWPVWAKESIDPSLRLVMSLISNQDFSQLAQRTGIKEKGAGLHSKKPPALPLLTELSSPGPLHTQEYLNNYRILV